MLRRRRPARRRDTEPAYRKIALALQKAEGAGYLPTPSISMSLGL